MNTQELLDLLGNPKDRYVLEADESRTAGKKPLRFRKMMLIAAVVAMALLLVGCVAVFLSLQDMAIAQETVTQEYDEQGKALEEPIEKTRSIVTFAGYQDSPAQQAAREWYQFQESYDPEGLLMDNNPDHPEIPNHLEYNYFCYTAELADKVQEIAGKYGVKLLEEWVPIQRWQSGIALEALGVPSLLKHGAQAEMGKVSGMLYPPYNFDFEFEFQLTGEDAAWGKKVWADAAYKHKDYLPSYGAWHLVLEDYDQWNYTTADGVELLLAMNQTGHGFMICEQEDAFYTISISGNTTGSAYPGPDQVPGREALEQMAEAFDFTLVPQAIDKAAMEPALDAAEEKHQTENLYVEPTWGGYEDYMKEMGIWLGHNAAFTFHDLTGDGQEELLIGYPQEDGTVLLDRYILLENGEAAETHIGLGYLCEDNVFEMPNEGYHSSFCRWYYYRRAYGGEREEEYLGSVQYNPDGTWGVTTESGVDMDKLPAVPKEEADAFRAQFRRLELDWHPIADYPFAGGTTYGDYLAGLDEKLTSQQVRQEYANYVNRLIERDSNWYTHYRILDLNGDGYEDLLLSGNGEFYWSAYTWRYGDLLRLCDGDFYLCENGALERVGTYHEFTGTEYEEHQFFTFDGQDQRELRYLAYNKATASWQSDLDGTPVPTAEAQAFFDKYPRMDQGMKPISDLIG